MLQIFVARDVNINRFKKKWEMYEVKSFIQIKLSKKIFDYLSRLELGKNFSCLCDFFFQTSTLALV